MTGSAPSLQTDLGARLAQPGNRLSRTSPAVRRGLVAVAAGAFFTLFMGLTTAWARRGL